MDAQWTHLYANERKFDTPVHLKAEVVHGFKRGSKELGIPTANLSMTELGEVGQSLDTGIYYGVAILQDISYNAVVSVGWNPFYKNVEKTVEAHIIDEKLDDFYGEILTVNLFGYLRPESNFSGLGNLFSFW